MVWLLKTWSEKVNLAYMDTGSFIFYVKMDDIYKNKAEDVGKSFDTSNYDVDRPLPMEKKKS